MWLLLYMYFQTILNDSYFILLELELLENKCLKGKKSNNDFFLQFQ